MISKKKLVLFIWLQIFILSFSVNAFNENVKQILKNIDSTLFADDKPKGISTKIVYGNINMPEQKISASVVSYFKAPNKFKIITTFEDGKTEIAAYNGTYAWKKTYNKKKGFKVKGKEKDYLVFNSYMEAPNLSWDLLFSKISLDTDEYIINGSHCYKLICQPNINFGVDKNIVFYVDKKSFLIKKMESYAYTSAGIIPQTIIIEKYKPFDNVNIPEVSKTNILGAEIVYNVRNALFNSEIKNSIFEL